MRINWRALIDLNSRASRWMDLRLPKYWRVDGNRDFKDIFVWKYCRQGCKIYDVGGGKQPFLTVEQKRRLQSQVIGLDISGEELGRAPVGAYDNAIAADICSYSGPGDGDLVICQALLEHVPDIEAALTSISTLLKPGGLFLLFVPCRNAPFARLNLLLPEHLKRRILFSIFPSTRYAQGFPSYYDRCTPSQVTALARNCGFNQVELRRYHMSTYFMFCVPLYILWRCWTMASVMFRLKDACETFSIAFQLQASTSTVSARELDLANA